MLSKLSFEEDWEESWGFYNIFQAAQLHDLFSFYLTAYLTRVLVGLDKKTQNPADRALLREQIILAFPVFCGTPPTNVIQRAEG